MCFIVLSQSEISYTMPFQLFTLEARASLAHHMSTGPNVTKCGRVQHTLLKCGRKHLGSSGIPSTSHVHRAQRDASVPYLPFLLQLPIHALYPSSVRPDVPHYMFSHCFHTSILLPPHLACSSSRPRMSSAQGPSRNLANTGVDAILEKPDHRVLSPCACTALADAAAGADQCEGEGTGCGCDA